MEQILKPRSYNATGDVIPGASVTTDPTTGKTNVTLSVPTFSTQDKGYLSATAGLLAIAGGLWFAYKQGAKWYGYVGYALLFGLIGGIVGEVGDRTIKAIKAS